MALTKSTQEELQIERKRLASLKKAIDDQIAAINHLLAPTELPLAQAEIPTGGQIASGDSLSGLGLRDAIRSVFRDEPAGLDGKRLQRILTERGYVPGGKTPLRTQVAGELWRMEKKGELEKIGRGAYRPRKTIQTK